VQWGWLLFQAAPPWALCLGMTVVKQVAVSIAVAVITVAVAEYVAWILG
jgi:hypothetical protein